METTLKTAPTAHPVTLTEIKQHLHIPVDDYASDSYLPDILDVAVDYVENITWRKLITQTWYAYLDAWPAGDYIELPFGSLQSVTAIKYTDSDGNQSTWSSSEYIVGTDYLKGRVTLADGYTWPNEVLYDSVPIEIEFVCGYGAAASVPPSLKHAIKILVGEYYENREPSVVGTIYTKIDTVDNLLSGYRLNKL